jgi:predicted transcriptional regulator
MKLADNVFYDQLVALPILRELLDTATYRIILSTIDNAKTVSQICHDENTNNNLPPSSTYKKIKKLLKVGLISIEKIHIDDRGKRVLFYKSNIKSLEFYFHQNGMSLQFNKNDSKG